MKNQVVYSSHKQSPLRMSSQNQYDNPGTRNNGSNQGISANKTFYQQNLVRNSSASQNIVDSNTNYSFSKLNTRNISPNPTSENQAFRSKQNFGSDLKLQQIQFNYASPSQEQLKDKEKESRAKSAGRNNIRARYLSQNQKQQQNAAGMNINNINQNIMNTQILMNQLQSSTKNINEEDYSSMKKSQQYRIKQNLNSSTKNMIDVLGRTQIPQQASTKNTNNMNSSEVEDTNHTSSGIFLKKMRNNSHGGGNLPFRNKIGATSGSGGSGIVIEAGQKNTSQSYHIQTNLNMINNNLSSAHPNQNISNNASSILNMNQSSKNADNSSSFAEMNMDNLNFNNLTESQIRQTRINNLKNYIQNNYNSSSTTNNSNNNTNQQINSDDQLKPQSGTKSPNNLVINTNQGVRSSSQKNPQVVKHSTQYGGYFQNGANNNSSNQSEKVQPLKALHNFTDSDIQFQSQKNTQELQSGRGQYDKDLNSSTSQSQKKMSMISKKETSSNAEEMTGLNGDYLQNINNTLNYFKNIGQTYSTNTSSLLSQNLTEKEANIEEMHFYAVEFQQNCKKWLSHIEDQKI